MVESSFKELVLLISVIVAMKEVVFTIFCFISPTTKGAITKVVVEKIIIRLLQLL